MKRAFTLIEQLAALALLALFATAMLAVLRGIVKAHPSATSSSHAAIDRAIDQVSCDLAQSQRVTFGDNRLVLGGFGSLDPSTVAATHRPVRIEYWIEQPVDAPPRLWRSQRSLDVLSNRNTWTACVCEGIARITVTPLGPTPPPTTRPARDVFSTVAVQPIPVGAEITLHAIPELVVAPVRRTVWIQGGR